MVNILTVHTSSSPTLLCYHKKNLKLTEYYGRDGEVSQKPLISGSLRVNNLLEVHRVWCKCFSV